MNTTGTWLCTGRNVVCDNMFTSMELELLLQHVTKVGTLRKNKADITREMQPANNRQEDSFILGFAGNVTMTSYVLSKGKTVIVPSIMHHDAATDGDAQKREVILHYNSKKSDQAAVVQITGAQRERVIVRWDDDRYAGWVGDWEARSVVINEDQERCLNTDGLGAVRPTHLLLYDEGELTPVVVKAGGWLRGGEGDAHIVTKLGNREYVDQEKNTHRCDACGQVLWTCRRSTVTLQAGGVSQ